ncbi:MAG TPA: alpha-amylase family protein [Aggregatilineales bacterium]|nr:alpha-amylase family protein [Aggregatilineales bacterium]
MSSASPEWLTVQARISLKRLLPRIEGVLPDPADRAAFSRRLVQHFPRLFGLLYNLYGDHYDFFYHLENILTAAARMYTDRAADLKALDAAREADPLWFESEHMVGGVCYVDLFAGTLAGLRAKIPYLKELGLTYLHLMPLFRVPDGENDGGYAVSSYREVKPELGTMAELTDLARALRAEGISLVLDFVFNHTADDHEWASKALEGDPDYQAYYWIFPNRSLPDQYERTLREIFPEQAPGSFTYRPEIDSWVWTTFHNYQWDLNYSNPQVFNAMMQELLFLANQGVEIIRLDAVAFIWKQMGTVCESLPQVHDIIQAYNAVLRIAAPAMLFKSEAIVHPLAVASYIRSDECQISYNPTMMALGWEALATRQVQLLRLSMQHWFDIPEDCAWVNYVRSHDDIGWTFSDEDAADLGINGFNHRQFLNRFYTGMFEGSFATGAPFNFNPVTQDMRISGTCASLAGLEQALKTDNALFRDHAVRRIVLLYSLAISAGGIPLIYLGDEIATLNDDSYRNDPAKAADSRWIHRSAFNWEAAERRHDDGTVEGRVFGDLRSLIRIRKSMPALGRGRTTFFDTRNVHVLGYTRNKLTFLANFSEQAQIVRRDVLLNLGEQPRDLVSGKLIPAGDLILIPYQFVWLSSQ